MHQKLITVGIINNQLNNGGRIGLVLGEAYLGNGGGWPWPWCLCKVCLCVLCVMLATAKQERGGGGVLFGLSLGLLATS